MIYNLNIFTMNESAPQKVLPILSKTKLTFPQKVATSELNKKMGKLY